uniref:GH3 domain-containing protein n=1 Tax=Strigamia maritima TaxID=126957 RepID=T1IPJ3_STRMM
MILEVAIAGIIILCTAATVAALTDIWRMRKSDSHTLTSLLHQYLVQSCLQLIGNVMYWKLHQDTGNCRSLQEKFLLRVLKRNRNTAYGLKYKFTEMKNKQDFIKNHPTTRYDHYETFIERIIKGEKNVLTAKDTHLLAVTSGTSGRSHILPITREMFLTFFLYGVAILSHCMVAAYPKVRQLQKILKFFYTPKERVSECGIPIGPSSSSPANSKSILPLYSTPLPGFEIKSEPEALYIHLLFALKDRNLGIIEANFASLVHHGFLNLHRQWQNLVEDIRLGRTNPNLDIPPEVREKLDKLLKPDPKRAKELEEEFIVGFEGISKRIWPHMNLVLATDTGSMKLYGDILKRVFTKGLSHYSPLYAATEGLIGINIWPLEEHAMYLLVPRSVFYEFIRIDDSDKEQPETLFTEEVKEGDVYELVVSTVNGLYRYRMGDVVKVVKFVKETPVVEFLYRQGQLLNVRGEKMSERLFFDAFQESVKSWQGKYLMDYCCAESGLAAHLTEFQNIQISPSPHYLVFLELDGTETLSEREKSTIDEKLREHHWVYDSFRTKGSIAPIAVYLVQPGTFLKLRSFLLETVGCSPNQVKVPRVIRSEAALSLLYSRVI